MWGKQTLDNSRLKVRPPVLPIIQKEATLKREQIHLTSTPESIFGRNGMMVGVPFFST
jgi:hypothetical protein